VQGIVNPGVLNHIVDIALAIARMGEQQPTEVTRAIASHCFAACLTLGEQGLPHGLKISLAPWY
jgi:hypothetical protein